MIKKTNKELFEIVDKEDKSKFPKSLNDNHKDRFSFEIIKHRDFWFSLGYGDNGDLGLNGNCYEWSNCFKFINPSLNLIHEILNFHNDIDKEDLGIMLKILKEQQNKLFFCKDDFRHGKEEDKHKNKRIVFNYFEKEDYRYMDTLTIKDYEKRFLK